MATLKQIDANRRNALKSTGPRTPEGKATVSMNALKHGLRARTVVLPGENLEEFQQLCDDLEAEWQPQSRTEQFYVEQMAVSQWKLTRMEVAEHGVYEEDAKVPMLDRIWKSQHSMERSYARAQRELERLQTTRRKQARQQPEADPAPATAEKDPATIVAAQVGQALSPAEPAPATAAPSATVPPDVDEHLKSDIRHPKSPPPY